MISRRHGSTSKEAASRDIAFGRQLAGTLWHDAEHSVADAALAPARGDDSYDTRRDSRRSRFRAAVIVDVDVIHEMPRSDAYRLSTAIVRSCQFCG